MEIDLNVVIEELMDEFKALKLQNVYLKAALKATQQELADSMSVVQRAGAMEAKRASRSRKDVVDEGVGEGVE